MGIIVVLILLCCFLAIVLYYPRYEQKCEKKRVGVFLSNWGPSISDALATILILQDSNRFFSDTDKNDFLKKYSGLYNAFIALKKQTSSLINEEDPQGPGLFTQFYSSINQHQFKNNVAYFNLNASTLPQEYSQIHSGARYVGHHEVILFKNKWATILEQFCSLADSNQYNVLTAFNVLKEAAEINNSADGLEKQRLKDNNAFIKKELFSKNRYFASIFTYPLDRQQCEAIVTLEDNTLVVSSAGSGKTSTIVGKARYLVAKKNVSPEDILIVTYTRKAAAELRERIEVEGITCSTFHKHALDTIGILTGKKPTIAEPSVMYNIYTSLVEHDKDYLKAFNKYVTEMVNLIKNDSKYPSAAAKVADLQKYGKRAPYRDMTGQYIYIKSRQEVQIVVALTNLGIDFCYEEPYPFDTSTTTHRQYKPDFTIHYRVPEEDLNGQIGYREKILYYEHFGIDDKGNVPKWFGDGLEGGWEAAQAKYTEGIQWKKKTHQQNHTDLMFTTSADFDRNSDIESYLEEILIKHGVPVKRLSEEEKRKKLQEASANVDLTLYRLINEFITLIKANDKTIPDLIKSISKKDEHGERNKFVLKQIITPVYTRYQEALLKNNLYDYTDLLFSAARECKKRNPYNYKYILVDEFQDMSMDKYTYLKALRKESPFTSLFCVGDDWQSIYRFSGSDMTLFYDFEDYFGYTKECKIETTHRFGQPLLNASSVFILSNPNQKVKTVKTKSESNTAIKFISYSGQGKRKDVERIIKNIPKEETIYILGRYGFTLDSILESNSQDNNRTVERKTISIAGRTVEYLTVHSSKGLEADHVIILDCDSDTYGFPSIIEDDPVLEYVLSRADSYEYAEERRVFYVAITRARKATYCFFDGKNPSPFMNEFGEYAKYSGSTDSICPRCFRGYVRIVKKGVSSIGNPYLSINCTNKSCDFFDTVFGDAVFKYIPRDPIRTWPFRLFKELIDASHFVLDKDNRVYGFIKEHERVLIPVSIAPNIDLKKDFSEIVHSHPERFEVSAVDFHNTIVYILKNPYSSIHCIDAELSNFLKKSKAFSSENKYLFTAPHIKLINNESNSLRFNVNSISNDQITFVNLKHGFEEWIFEDNMIYTPFDSFSIIGPIEEFKYPSVEGFRVSVHGVFQLNQYNEYMGVNNPFNVGYLAFLKHQKPECIRIYLFNENRRPIVCFGGRETEAQSKFPAYWQRMLNIYGKE